MAADDTRPALAPVGDALASQTAELPAHLAPSRAESATPNAATPTESGGAASAQRRPWRAIVVALLIVVVLAAALTVVFTTVAPTTPTATATATIAPTPTTTPIVILPTASFTKAGFYSLRYPAAWLVTQQNTTGGSLVVFSAQQGGGVNPAINIQVVPHNESPADMATRDTDVMTIAAAPNGIHNLAGLTSVIVGGQSWTELSADLTLKNTSQTVHLVVLSVAHGQLVYSVTYFAPTAAFAGLDAAAFQPALASFTFAS